METVCVYCAVRVEFLNKIQAKCSVQARALTEVVSRRPLTVKTRVRFKAIPCDTSFTQIGVYTGVLISP